MGLYSLDRGHTGEVVVSLRQAASFSFSQIHIWHQFCFEYTEYGTGMIMISETLKGSVTTRTSGKGMCPPYPLSLRVRYLLDSSAVLVTGTIVLRMVGPIPLQESDA